MILMPILESATIVIIGMARQITTTPRRGAIARSSRRAAPSGPAKRDGEPSPADAVVQHRKGLTHDGKMRKNRTVFGSESSSVLDHAPQFLSQFL